MLTFSGNLRIYLCTAPTDMRKSFDGLCGLVESVFEQKLLDGHLFLFLNRRRDRVRVTIIPKFACDQAAACGVKTPERPVGLVEGNRYDTSVAAEIPVAFALSGNYTVCYALDSFLTSVENQTGNRWSYPRCPISKTARRSKCRDQAASRMF